MTGDNIDSEVDEELERYPIPGEFVNDFREVKRLTEDLEYTEAKSLALRLLESIPEHPRLLVVYAKIVFHTLGSKSLENLASVEEILLKAIEIAPDLPEAHSFIGILYQLMEREKKAAKHVNIAVKLDAKSAESWNSIGLYYELQGDSQRAIDFFVAALTLDHDYYVAAYNASCVNAKMNRTEDALKYLKLVMSKRLLFGCEDDADFDNIRSLPEFQRIIEERLDR